MQETIVYRNNSISVSRIKYNSTSYVYIFYCDVIYNVTIIIHDLGFPHIG